MKENQTSVSEEIAREDGVTVGRTGGNNYPTDGVIDEVRLYNRSLSQSEVKKLYFYGQTGQFRGNYTRSGIEVPYGASPTTLQVTSTNVSSSTNRTWVDVAHSGGENDVIPVDAGNDVTKNYSLGVTGTGGTVDVVVNMMQYNETPQWTPTIKDYKLWGTGDGGTVLIDALGKLH